jgi:hypothetical protein
MKTLLLNLFVFMLAGLPLVALEVWSRRFRWTKERKGRVSIFVWLITIFLIWMLVAPRLGLVPNPRMFDF